MRFIPLLEAEPPAAWRKKAEVAKAEIEAEADHAKGSDGYYISTLVYL